MRVFTSTLGLSFIRYTYVVCVGYIYSVPSMCDLVPDRAHIGVPYRILRRFDRSKSFLPYDHDDTMYRVFNAHATMYDGYRPLPYIMYYNPRVVAVSLLLPTKCAVCRMVINLVSDQIHTFRWSILVFSSLFTLYFFFRYPL